jgi:antitoxin YefM
MVITSLADAKARLSELITSAETTHERTIITKNGRPAAVLIAFEDLEGLEETVFWLPDLDEVRGAAAETREPLPTRDEFVQARRRSRSAGSLD